MNEEGYMTQDGATGGFYPMCLLAAAVGYLSLSQEILWIRAIAYATGGRPVVFSQVLGFFLFGIAFGSLYGNRVTTAGRVSPLVFISRLLLASSVVYYLALPLTGMAFAVAGDGAVKLSYLAIGLVAFLLGGIFPVICHHAIPKGSAKSRAVGLSVSWVYLANIVGSTLGPLLTGFVLLDNFSLQTMIVATSLATLALSLVVFAAAQRDRAARVSWKKFAAAAILIALAMGFGQDRAYRHLLEKFHFKTEYDPENPYLTVVQSRSGIVAIHRQDDTDAIYGGGMYDGTFNVDPKNDTNGIGRAYMVSALHRHPKKVLEIGLASASWTRVLADYQAIQDLTVVEINPAYLHVLAPYPWQAAILENPKVKIRIDDGRRWLNRHPGEKFDLIVMNTTWHWRDSITNLVSREFLELAKSRLNPKGVLYYNTTFSEDIPYTAAHVFKHVVRYSNFVAASDWPFDLTREERDKNLGLFRRNGQEIFDLERADYAGLRRQFAGTPLPDVAPSLRKADGLILITDDNMATEFKSSAGPRFWVQKDRSWRRFFEKWL